MQDGRKTQEEYRPWQSIIVVARIARRKPAKTRAGALLAPPIGKRKVAGYAIRTEKKWPIAASRTVRLVRAMMIGWTVVIIASATPSK